MQKTNIRASILIWSIFLSMIISVTFISISTKINKNIKENYSLQSQIKNTNEVENIINSWSINWIYTNTILKNWEQIIFDNNNIYKSLKKWEKFSIKILKNNNLTISISEWSAIKYKDNTNSGIINSSLSFDTTIWNLEIINLWWYSKIKIDSDTENSFLLKYTNYKIIKKIWNKEVVKTKWEIKNF